MVVGDGRQGLFVQRPTGWIGAEAPDVFIYRLTPSMYRLTISR